jgi:hypothetical protein
MGWRRVPRRWPVELTVRTQVETNRNAAMTSTTCKSNSKALVRSSSCRVVIASMAPTAAAVASRSDRVGGSHPRKAGATGMSVRNSTTITQAMAAGSHIRYWRTSPAFRQLVKHEQHVDHEAGDAGG